MSLGVLAWQPMRLYGFPMSPNSRRAHLTLEEIGEPYEYVTVDLTQGEQKKPEYLALNPFGRVPTLVDGGLVIWESHAIMQYLTAKYPEKGLDAGSPAERGEISRWLFANAAHFGPSCSRIFAHTMRLPEEQRIARVAEEGRAEAMKTLGILEEALKGKEWLVSGRLTIADLSFAPTLAFAPMLGIELDGFPQVTGWLDRIKERPSFKKVYA